MSPTVTLAALRRELAAASDPVRAEGAGRYFKTGKGEYGEGDKFRGITLPELRLLARKARGLSLDNTIKLLRSPWHEDRTLALMVLVHAHARATPAERRKIHRAYLANARYVNNWDLVDGSAPELVGAYISEDGTRLVERLANRSCSGIAASRWWRRTWRRATAMPRTALRYSIERLTPRERKRWMSVR